MPLVIIAEGGRSWPEAQGQSPCDGFCGPEDIHAWGRRVAAEVHASNTYLSELAPGGQWLGPAAQQLGAEILAWQPGAINASDTAFYDTPAGQAAAMVQGGYSAVIDDLAAVIAQGIELNNRARVMAWEASQAQEPAPKPRPKPVECPPGYTPVSITEPDGTIVQFCQGTAPQPEPPPPQPDPGPDEDQDDGGGGGGLLLFLGLAAGVGALALYSKRGTISGKILHSFRK
jgi:hypothetical protein